MPRVEIDLPERWLFRTRIPIRIDDINYGGHLANDAVLSLAQEARIRFLEAHGWSELDLGGGSGIVMIDAAVVYRAEGRRGMELEVTVGAADVRTRGFDLLYRLADVATGEEIARAKTGIVCFDYAARRVVRVPAPVLAALQGEEAPGTPPPAGRA